MTISPSYIGAYPTPSEITAKTYIASLTPALADYARAYWASLLTGSVQPELGEVTSLMVRLSKSASSSQP